MAEGIGLTPARYRSRVDWQIGRLWLNFKRVKVHTNGGLPVGLYLKTAELAASKDPSYVGHMNFSPPVSYTAPEAFHSEQERDINPELRKQFVEERHEQGPPLGVTLLRDCYILPSGAIITAAGNLIAESCLPYHVIPDINAAFKGELEIDGATVDFTVNNLVIEDGTLFYMREHGENGFFHWVQSVWPRLMAVEALNLSDNVQILTPTWAPFQSESLTLSGVPQERLRPVDRQQTIFVRSLIFPSALVEKGDFWLRPPQLNSFFDKLPVERREARIKLFISRPAAAARYITNEPELKAALEARGFVSLRFEELPFLEQAALMKSADLVVGAHGAGLSHISFMDPGTAVLEILSPMRFWPTYRALSARRGVRFGFVVGNEIEAPVPDANSPFSVDIQKVLDVLDQIERE